jgi:hypothetical protein
MSVYTEVQTEIKDLDLLMAAIEMAGLTGLTDRYANEDGKYRKWTRYNARNETGLLRGSDAAVVIHGGLDTTPRRYCGDTAFVWDADAQCYKAKLDIAHGNAKANWDKIQNGYAILAAERLALQRGFRVQRDGYNLRVDVEQRTPRLARLRR